jgi:hypothetical protein
VSTRFGVYGRAGGRFRWLFAAGFALAIPIALSAPAAADASAVTPTTAHLQVLSTETFTPTGILLHAGDLVSVTATGTIHFGGGRVAAMTPPGIPWGTCAAIAGPGVDTTPWPAPGQSCWSLIARIGTAPAFEIGSHRTFHASHRGELSLGVNDTYLVDNYGKWSATVTVKPAPIPKPRSPRSKITSSTKVFLFIAVWLVAVLVVIGAFWHMISRRRSASKLVAADSPVAGPDLPEWPIVDAVPVPKPEGEPKGSTPAAAALASVAAEPASSPPEIDPLEVTSLAHSSSPNPAPVPEYASAGATSLALAPAEIDPLEVSPHEAKIFAVDFLNGWTLRVGYTHFPKGSVLQWRVTQNRAVAATGYFITKGGEDVDHVETIPLGMKLEGPETHPEGADVQFDWTLAGVPYQYAVRRDANC